MAAASVGEMGKQVTSGLLAGLGMLPKDALQAWPELCPALSLPDLFKLDGRYSYRGGTNTVAMIALVVAILPVIPGFLRAATTPGGVVPNPTPFDHFYTYAWFVTFALSAAIYLLLMRQSRDVR